MSKPVFYTFGGSVWAAVPELAIRELGYPSDAIDIRILNLLEAENFEPKFLNINEHGTLPTLLANGETYKTTKEVLNYLIDHAPKPAGKASGTDLIEKVHEAKADPNFAFLLARNDEELQAKIGGKQGFPYLYITNRQNKLKSVTNAPGADAHAKFYEAKQTGDALAQKLYGEVATEEEKATYFKISTEHWVNLRAFILSDLPGYLPESGFIGGERPGEDDFHLGGWLARIVACTGGSDINALAGDAALGKSVPEKLVAYWKTWSGRESWKEVYADGLH
ncbi:hypothetical protein SCHPADRAFT_881503 [Schizopora paradoxa]|uniref:GST N-terminal domain-containing protein n=1 Tax=Schizopora paradoxa TaxID=27342 RepID=A0A0H2R882_9AGAM|nr:hypothetical protein SCHPADRAFT_881503 [Schizopora paradoxa]